MPDTVSVKSTYGTYLKVKPKAESGTTSAYEILCPITDFPDLGGEPEMLQTTTLGDKAHTYIEGIQSMDALTFTTNLYFGADNVKGSFLYIKKNYDSTSDSYEFAIDFVKDPYGTGAAGETGLPSENGNSEVLLRASWKGQLSIWVNGGGVDEVVSCTISISPSTPITYEKPAA